MSVKHLLNQKLSHFKSRGGLGEGDKLSSFGEPANDGEND